jgi:hypothetical protein
MTWLSISGAHSCSGFASWYGIWDFAMKRELNCLQELLHSRPASFIAYLKDTYLHSNTQMHMCIQRSVWSVHCVCSECRSKIVRTITSSVHMVIGESVRPRLWDLSSLEVLEGAECMTCGTITSTWNHSIVKGCNTIRSANTHHWSCMSNNHGTSMSQICLKRSMHSNKCQEWQFLAYIKLHANYSLFGHRLQVLSSCSAQLPIVFIQWECHSP